MFYDLNVPWSGADQKLLRTLAFLHELGYGGVALNYTISGKLPAEITNPIPNPLPFPTLPPTLAVLRRVTLVLTESYQNARLAALAKEFDLLAVRPVDERTLQLACGSLDCDIISLDMTQRLPYFFKHKMLNEAIRAGKRFEICYSQGVVGDAQARRSLISNATQLIRASRGRGLVLSSESKVGAVGCRAPLDVTNLMAVWGLGEDRGHDAVCREPRAAVAAARLKRTSYRGVVDVVFGGERVEAEKTKTATQGLEGKQLLLPHGQKRKAGEDGENSERLRDGEGTPISKREAKRRARQARIRGETDAGAATALKSGDETAKG